MVIHEAECVALKRRGAEHVAQMLLGKSRLEEIEFWRKRTESLRSHQSHNKVSSSQQARQGLPGISSVSAR